MIGVSVCQSVYMEPFQPKEEEENSMHNTVVMFSTSDHFTLKQVHNTCSHQASSLMAVSAAARHPTISMLTG